MSAEPSEEEFTRRMAERFRSALPERTVEIAGPLQLRINVEPDVSEISVWRIFNYCANATPEECEASIDYFVASQAEAIENLGAPVTRDQLRVAVRHADFSQAIHGDRPPDSEEPATKPFLPGLCLTIVADFPTYTRSVSARQLGEMGLTLEAGWRLAERQTLDEFPRPDEIEGLEDQAVFLTERRYLPTLLLDLEGWRAAFERHGDLLAAIPDNYSMFIARADRIADLEALKGVVGRNFEEAERGVSPTVFRFGGMGWEAVE